jgi:DNA-directed RNA polymerase specialized sigma24 family protein
MPELADRLSDAARAATEVRAAEDELEKVRVRFREAVYAAREAGASYGLIGKVVGLTRQRVARIIESG